jgi:hypothetical protein
VCAFEKNIPARASKSHHHRFFHRIRKKSRERFNEGTVCEMAFGLEKGSKCGCLGNCRPERCYETGFVGSQIVEKTAKWFECRLEAYDLFQLTARSPFNQRVENYRVNPNVGTNLNDKIV